MREVWLFDESSILANASTGKFSLVNDDLGQKLAFDVRELDGGGLGLRSRDSLNTSRWLQRRTITAI
jgi:hypothetical protein